MGSSERYTTRPAFAVLPYIATEAPFPVAGITFRSNQDTEGLSQEEVEHLNDVGSLFYLADDEPISEFVYAIMRFSDDRDQISEQVRRMQSAHTILTFLVTTQGGGGTYEQLSLYLAIPTEVFARLSSETVPGYSVTINWLNWTEIARGGRLYTPLPFPGVFRPHYWNLSDVAVQMKRRAVLSGLEVFVAGEILDQPEQVDRFETVLRAMSWYNKSFSQVVSEEEKLIYVAVAFEVLFHHQQESKTIREELKTHLRGLFGEAPRLNEWVDQFYGERSRILHEGFSSRLDFVVDANRATKQQLVMDSLVSYGRQLLRMCILIILYGSFLSEEANLGLWFTHDKERLQEICRLLNRREIPADQRLQSVVKPIYELGEIWAHYRHQQGVDLKTLRSTGKMLAQSYLEAHPKAESSVREHLKSVIELESENPQDLYDAYSILASELGKGLATFEGQYRPKGPLATIAQFAKYAEGHFLWATLDYAKP